MKYENFYVIPTTLQFRWNYRYIRKNVTQIQKFNIEVFIKDELNNKSSDKQQLKQRLKSKKENKLKGDLTAIFKFIMYMSHCLI